MARSRARSRRLRTLGDARTHAARGTRSRRCRSKRFGDPPSEATPERAIVGVLTGSAVGIRSLRSSESNPIPDHLPGLAGTSRSSALGTVRAVTFADRARSWMTSCALRPEVVAASRVVQTSLAASTAWRPANASGSGHARWSDEVGTRSTRSAASMRRAILVTVGGSTFLATASWLGVSGPADSKNRRISWPG